MTFLEKLKLQLINNNKEELPTLIPYYETMVQHEKMFQELDCLSGKYDMLINYREPESDEYYTDGKIIVLFSELNEEGWFDYQQQLNFHYEIELIHDERMYGYCDCRRDMSGYSIKHRCCGNGCDWIAPAIRITKVDLKGYGTFEGVERDVWQLEESWSEHLKEHNKQQINSKLVELDDQIASLMKRKEDLSKKLSA